MPRSPAFGKAVSAGRAAEGGEEAASRAAAFCPPRNRLLMPPSRPPVRFPLLPTELPSSRFPAPLKRLSMPGANFMPTNTAASLPSVEATCGPLFAR